MKLINLIISILLVGLFFVSMITMIISFSNENEVESIQDNPAIKAAFQDLSTKLNESSGNATSIEASFMKDTAHPYLGALGFAFTSLLSAGNTLMISTTSIINIIFIFSTSVFHVNPIVTGTLTAIITLALVFYVWRVIRAGE